MCYGLETTGRDFAKSFSNDAAENLLQTTLMLERGGADLRAPELVCLLDLSEGWSYWTALQMLSRRAPNSELIASEVSEQFVATKLLKGLPGYDGKRKLRPYCVTALGRLLISRVRRQDNHKRIERDKAIMQARANKYHKKACKSRLEIEEQRCEVRRAVRRLPRNLRRAVILRDWFNVSAVVGAKRLEITPTKFTRWVHNGRQRVRKSLGNDFMDEVG